MVVPLGMGTSTRLGSSMTDAAHHRHRARRRGRRVSLAPVLYGVPLPQAGGSHAARAGGSAQSGDTGGMPGGTPGGGAKEETPAALVTSTGGDIGGMPGGGTKEVTPGGITIDCALQASGGGESTRRRGPAAS